MQILKMDGFQSNTIRYVQISCVIPICIFLIFRLLSLLQIPSFHANVMVENCFMIGTTLVFLALYKMLRHKQSVNSQPLNKSQQLTSTKLSKNLTDPKEILWEALLKLYPGIQLELALFCENSGLVLAWTEPMWHGQPWFKKNWYGYKIGYSQQQLEKLTIKEMKLLAQGTIFECVLKNPNPALPDIKIWLDYGHDSEYLPENDPVRTGLPQILINDSPDVKKISIKEIQQTIIIQDFRERSFPPGLGELIASYV